MNDRTQPEAPATPAQPQRLPLGCRVYQAAQSAGIVVLESAAPITDVRPLLLMLESDPPELVVLLNGAERPTPIEYIGILDYGTAPRTGEDDIPKSIEQLQAKGRTIDDLQAPAPFVLPKGRELKLRFQLPREGAAGMRVTRATLIVDTVPPKLEAAKSPA